MTKAEPANQLGFRHSRVRELRALVAKRAARESANSTVIEGPVALAAALQAGIAIHEVFVDPESTHERSVLDLLPPITKVHQLAPGVLKRVAPTVTPQGVIAVVERKTLDLASLKAGPVAVLVDIADPGNAGTIIRSAEAAGLSGVIACGSTVDLFSPKVVRSAASALFDIDIVVAGSTQSTLTALQERGYRLLATRASGGDAYYDTSLGANAAILIGNEAHGLDATLAVDSWVTIPMRGKAESLNAAVAASLVFFEIARQSVNHSTKG